MVSIKLREVTLLRDILPHLSVTDLYSLRSLIGSVVYGSVSCQYRGKDKHAWESFVNGAIDSIIAGMGDARNAIDLVIRTTGVSKEVAIFFIQYIAHMEDIEMKGGWYGERVLAKNIVKKIANTTVNAIDSGDWDTVFNVAFSIGRDGLHREFVDYMTEIRKSESQV